MTPTPTLAKPVFKVFAVELLVALPFVVLLRGSVYLYERLGWSAWMALVVAALATLLLVAIYGAWLAWRFTGRARVTTIAKWVAAPLVVVYCGHALLFLSRAHAQGEGVRAEYGATHPLLRLALATVILANEDIVITDMSRLPADYAGMGLPVFDGTLHARQRDGWVHAVDLRTAGRGMVQNWLVEWYFEAMGFRTLRHVGTADHLHVELPLP